MSGSRESRQQVNRYPNDVELQQQLQETVDWQSFRRRQLKTTVKLVKHRSANYPFTTIRH